MPDNALIGAFGKIDDIGKFVHQLFRMRQNMLTTIIQLISVMRLSMLIVPIFASQAMYAGGWKKNYEWMGNDVATTNAWAVADDFYWYGLGRSLTTYANMIPVSGSPYQTMRTGDLMFFTYSGSRKIKHAMIITKIIMVKRTLHIIRTIISMLRFRQL